MLGQVFVQPDARLVTRTVSRANLIEGTNERFGVVVDATEALDGIGQHPACGRVLVQEFLPFRPDHALPPRSRFVLSAARMAA
jgi:hypothetical protein